MPGPLVAGSSLPPQPAAPVSRRDRLQSRDDRFATLGGPAASAARWADTARMAERGSLKRLGGGRWESRDGRFTIEPQSGTWGVVDGERTDELGLPQVRGPFPSLTAARADIETARAEPEAKSPLASRIEGASPRKSPAATSPRGARGAG